MHMVLWKYNDEIAIIKIIEIGSVIEHHPKKKKNANKAKWVIANPNSYSLVSISMNAKDYIKADSQVLITSLSQQQF